MPSPSKEEWKQLHRNLGKILTYCLTRKHYMRNNKGEHRGWDVITKDGKTLFACFCQNCGCPAWGDVHGKLVTASVATRLDCLNVATP